MTASKTLRIEWDHEQMTRRHKLAPTLIEKAIDIVADKHAIDSQTKARHNAPWTDRTGNARNGLFGEARRDAEGVSITLAHNVSYGIFLETMQSGRYSIIMPTLEAELPLTIASLKKLYKALG